MAKTKTPKFTSSDAYDEVIAAVEKLRATLVSEGVSIAATAADAEDVDDDDEEDGEVEPLDRETVEALAIKDLRTLAKEYGVDATKKADILEALEEFYEDDDEDEDDDEADEDDEDDEDDDDDEEGEELDRDDLEEMSLKELRVLAKENGHTAADYKGMDQDAIIDLIMGEDDEDEDGDEDDDEDEDDEDVEELDEDALNDMTQKDLLALAKEIEVKVPAALKKNSKANHKKLVALILDSGDEE